MSSIYLCGPITGLDPEECQRRFAEWEWKMVRLGYRTVNPVELDRDLENRLGRVPTREEYLRNDLYLMLTCDEILMIPGWTNSKGALLERKVAMECGIPVSYWEELI